MRCKRALRVGLVVITSVLGIAPTSSYSHALSTADQVNRQAKACGVVLNNLPLFRDQQKLVKCMDFYFFYQDFDPEPGSFNAPIKIGYRVISLNPHFVDIYRAVAWMLWSKWETWTENPEAMPDGESKLNEAVNLLSQGLRYNTDSVVYLVEAAYVLWPVAQRHKPELYDLVLNWFVRADVLMSAPIRDRIRVRLNIAHIYRNTLRTEAAIAGYLAVLELDPSQQTAQRFLTCLRSIEGCPRTAPVPNQSLLASQ